MQNFDDELEQELDEDVEHAPLQYAMTTNAPQPPPMDGFLEYSASRASGYTPGPRLAPAVPPPEENEFDSELARAVRARSQSLAEVDAGGPGLAHVLHADDVDEWDPSMLHAPARAPVQPKGTPFVAVRCRLFCHVVRVYDAQ